MPIDDAAEIIPPTPPKMDISALSEQARMVLDATVLLWLRSTKLGHQLTGRLGREGAVSGIYELLEEGILMLYTSGDIEHPATTISIELTPYGRTLFGPDGELSQPLEGQRS